MSGMPDCPTSDTPRGAVVRVRLGTHAVFAKPSEVARIATSAKQGRPRTEPPPRAERRCPRPAANGGRRWLHLPSVRGSNRHDEARAGPVPGRAKRAQPKAIITHEMATGTHTGWYHHG